MPPGMMPGGFLSRADREYCYLITTREGETILIMGGGLPSGWGAGRLIYVIMRNNSVTSLITNYKIELLTFL